MAAKTEKANEEVKVVDKPEVSKERYHVAKKLAVLNSKHGAKYANSAKRVIELANRKGVK
jgi:hypothetical protein